MPDHLFAALSKQKQQLEAAWADSAITVEIEAQFNFRKRGRTPLQQAILSALAKLVSANGN
jgi:hypothetical protein